MVVQSVNGGTRELPFFLVVFEQRRQTSLNGIVTKTWILPKKWAKCHFFLTPHSRDQQERLLQKTRFLSLCFLILDTVSPHQTKFRNILPVLCITHVWENKKIKIYRQQPPPELLKVLSLRFLFTFALQVGISRAPRCHFPKLLINTGHMLLHTWTEPHHAGGHGKYFGGSGVFHACQSCSFAVAQTCTESK